MYPSDFNSADPVYSQVDEPLFLGLPPLLAFLLILLLIAVGVGMFMLGRWRAEQGQGDDVDKAPREIHEAILNASRAAMAASSDELRSRAQALRQAITDHIGPVLVVGQAGKSIAKLDEALKGEIKEAKADDHAHGHGHAQGHGDAHAAAVPPVTVNQIFVGGSHPQAPAHDDHHKPDKPHAEPRAETRPMTGPEQIDHLSRAVRAFHDHWSNGPERIRELREARRALSRRPPASALKSSGDGRVWDRH